MPRSMSLFAAGALATALLPGPRALALCDGGCAQIDGGQDAGGDDGGCLPIGAVCTVDGGACCGTPCNGYTGRCPPALGGCVPLGQACSGDADCCALSCVDGGCEPVDGGPAADPDAGACLPNGATCADGGAPCCGAACLQGACPPALGGCAPLGQACSGDADCCALSCVDGGCEPVDAGHAAGPDAGSCLPAGASCADGGTPCCGASCLAGACPHPLGGSPPRSAGCACAAGGGEAATLLLAAVAFALSRRRARRPGP